MFFEGTLAYGEFRSRFWGWLLVARWGRKSLFGHGEGLCMTVTLKVLVTRVVVGAFFFYGLVAWFLSVREGER